MSLKKHRKLSLVPLEAKTVVETPEHERIEFDACSPEELRAKLHDFYAWAS